ncbi:hypothetical protein HRI_004816900 [Hibiscus trionum]|uniref:EF-hand domain-containing protein n=1 Tax=Hibiscus trionum TaxID=183268 RepID=A0A9W7JE43_HIBTR|nr:hypothetical protein HRI_004816900 [Hibiscus trionum]
MDSSFLETSTLPYIPLYSSINPTFFLSFFPSADSSSSSSSSSGLEDFLPLMAKKLGGEGLVGELCNGFELLMDREKGVITFDSLKEKAAVLGLQDLRDDELRSMVREGDFDGDGALNQMEFCVLMFRLSPQLMEASRFLLEQAFQHEFKDCL